MFNITKTKSVVLVALMLVVAAGGAMAAAPSVNTETTDTSYTTDLEDGDTQTYNDTTDSVFSWSADSENSSIEITHDGETLYEDSPDYDDAVDTDDSGDSDTWYYNATLADDGSDYEGLEVGAGESLTLNVTLTNDTEADDPDTTNVSYTYEHTDEFSMIASEDPESEEADGLFGSFSLSTLNVLSDDSEDEDVGTVVSTDSTTVGENTSEVQLDTVDSNLSDAFETSTSDASGGDLIWSSYAQLTVDDDSQYVPVYYEEAGDQEWLDTDEDAYATISEDGESMTIHNPDALLGEDDSSATMDVTTVGDEKLGAQNARAMLSDDMYDVSGVDLWTSTFGAADFNGNPDFVDDALEA